MRCPCPVSTLTRYSRCCKRWVLVDGRRRRSRPSHVHSDTAAAAHVHLTSIPTRPLPLTSISRPFRLARRPDGRQLPFQEMPGASPGLGQPSVGLAATLLPCVLRSLSNPAKALARERIPRFAASDVSRLKTGPPARHHDGMSPGGTAALSVAPLPAGPGLTRLTRLSVQIGLQSHWHQPTRRSHCRLATCQRPNAAT